VAGGVLDVIARLERIRDEGHTMADLAADAMAAVMVRQVIEELGRSSHPPGTPTPSAPGDPPSLITGTLRRSVMAKNLGPGFRRVGATTIYARIQELSGDTGRGHATHLPARPYLKPAREKALRPAYEAAIAVIREALLS